MSEWKPSKEDVERVAKSLHQATHPSLVWNDIADMAKALFRRDARAAIEELRGMGWRSRDEVDDARAEARSDAIENYRLEIDSS